MTNGCLGLGQLELNAQVDKGVHLKVWAFAVLRGSGRLLVVQYSRCCFLSGLSAPGKASFPPSSRLTYRTSWPMFSVVGAVAACCPQTFANLG